jgi:cyclophilin family peptidyl-prolyl cis-trans isomerase
MAELQQAQKRRRRNTRVIPVIAVAIALAIGLAIYTSSQNNSKKVSTSGTTTATTGSSTTAAPATTLAPGTQAGLLAHTAPAVSTACNVPASGPAGSGAAPASGHAVSIVPAPAHVPLPKLDGSSPRYTKFSAAPPFCINTTKTYTAVMTTDIGPMTIKLLPKDAPVTVNNFVFLAGYHYFDGIVFHRVIPGFVNQGGDPTGTGTGGPGYTFKDELPSSNAAYGAGAVAMANSGPNTNGSQFFIVMPGGGSQLQPLYSTFGQVTSGLPVAQKINSDGTQGGTPAKYHKILKVTITET